MICDDRDVPLDEFETAMLAELLSAHAEFTTDGEDGANSNVVPLAPARKGRRPVVAVAVAGVAAALVAAGAVTMVTRHTDTASATPALPEPLAFAHGSHAAAVAFLDQAAGLQNAVPRSGGPVLYAETQNYALSITVNNHLSSTVVSTTIRQVWEAANGATRVKEYTQDTQPAGGDVGGPKPVGGINHTGTYKPGGWADPNAGLPTTSAGALAALQAQAEKSETADSSSPDAGVDDFTIGDQVANDLGTGTATPGQTAANYQVLASAPGVFYAGQVTDNAGRTGDAVGVEVSYQDPVSTGIEYFVIDPTTGAILEVEEVDTPAPPALHFPPGPTVQQYAVILNSGFVAAPSVVPTNRTWNI